MSEFEYDLFVIGVGSGGVRAARMSAAQGKRVATAEDRYMGVPASMSAAFQRNYWFMLLTSQRITRMQGDSAGMKFARVSAGRN